MKDKASIDPTAPASTIDRKEFRSALGAFATGVTIVTTCHEGIDVGLTANSFNSVSLDPPMVLWSLGKTSLSLPHFAATSHFAVHILSDEQEALSARFATRGADKFGGLDFERGHHDLPLLTGCVARFQCRKLFEYEGGDHVIFVGEVVAFDHVSKRPLLFHGGQYAVAAPRKETDESKALADAPAESLGYLITRAYFGLRAPALRHAEERGISWADRYLLGALLDMNGRAVQEVNDLIGYTGLKATAESVRRLVKDGYVTTTRSTDGTEIMWLSESGREYCLSMIARTRASEAEAEIQLGQQGPVLKHLLKRLVETAHSTEDSRMGRHMDMIARNIESFGGLDKHGGSPGG
ncbi:MAG: flavin reductase family protein [Steroidobacteraceae bacterium]|jgi:3-hydroxy-9,10-secoandrosta-1,3,5(10)-triene-9,17-dione monooxygenase reductase component